ncbi:MAG TPA: hypothetical protein VH724_00830 [Candidatus Angelobacter sp.]|nr:hypothetical protein [Candidatus Angelobacter sp.]
MTSKWKAAGSALAIGFLYVMGAVNSVGQTQDAGIASVQAELPANLKLMQDALSKRQAAHLQPGALKDSNTAVVQTLTGLVERTSALQSLLGAGPTANEAPLMVEEWKQIKAKMQETGLTPREQTASNSSGAAKTAQPSASDSASSSAIVAATVQPSGANSVAPQASASSTPPAQPATARSGFATPISDLSSMTFTYDIGVSPIFNPSGPGFQGGCTIGNGAITSDDAIWDVVISLVAKQMQGYQTLSPFAQTNGQGVVVVPLITMDQNTQLLVSGRKAYIGAAEQNIIAPKFHFKNLSLNEVTDLLQSLKGNDVKIKAAFGAGLPKITVYQVLLPPDANAAVSLVALEGQLLSTPELITHENLVSQLSALAGTDVAITPRNSTPITVHVEQPIVVTYTAPELTGDTADDLAKFASNLANLGMHGDLNLAKSVDRLTKADGTPGGQPGGKPLVIENECFQLSFTPGIQNGGVSPSANFRARISYIPDTLPVTLKLSAEGEAASDVSKPRRVAASGDFTYLSSPFWGGWYATFGATGNSSYAQTAGIGITEWRGGGKFELQTPVQKFFPVRGGNDQKPTFTVEAGGIGGTMPNTKTNFVVRGDFIYTLQPSAKIFLDFRAAAAHSQDGRFAGRNDFSFGGFTGRYTIYNDWDFIAKYECGRKDPLYVKSCGWQTGFGLKTK